MVYNYQKITSSFYAIKVGNGKVYGLLLETLIPHIDDMKVHVFLVDENEKTVCEVSRPFGFALKSYREGINLMEDMLKELAEYAKSENIDFNETFKEIQKDIKQK